MFSVPPSPPQLSLFDGKICSKCKSWVPYTEFSRDRSRKDGCGAQCKQCKQIRPRERYALDPESARARQREYKARDPEKWRAYNHELWLQNRDVWAVKGQEWRRANRDLARLYLRRYREKYPEKAAEYRDTNKEAIRQRVQRWREANPDRAKYTQRQWNLKNPDKNRTKTARYRALKMSAPGSYTAEEFHALCERHNNLCLCCGEIKPLTVDHVIPLSKGGSNDISNIQPLCKRCNNRKFTKTIDYRPHTAPSNSLSADA